MSLFLSVSSLAYSVTVHTVDSLYITCYEPALLSTNYCPVSSLGLIREQRADGIQVGRVITANVISLAFKRA